MLHIVRAVFLLIAFEVGYPLAVRTPFQSRAASPAVSRRDLFGRGAGLCIRYEDLPGRLSVGVLGMIADESYARAVRRPRRRGLIPFSIGQSIELRCRYVEQINIAVATREDIALPVLLEFVPVDDYRFWRLGFCRGRVRGILAGSICVVV